MTDIRASFSTRTDRGATRRRVGQQDAARQAGRLLMVLVAPHTIGRR